MLAATCIRGLCPQLKKKAVPVTLQRKGRGLVEIQVKNHMDSALLSVCPFSSVGLDRRGRGYRGR